MKNLIVILCVMVSSTSFAGLNKEAFYKAYREYLDRDVQLLPLSNEKIVIDKVVNIGTNNQGNSIYTVYLNIKMGSAQYNDAVQVVADKNGQIDSYSGMFSMSVVMVRDEKGKDIRFPFEMSEMQYALMAQKAFDVAQKEFAKVYLDPEYVGTFYIQTDSYNVIDKTVTLEVISRGLPGSKSKSRMTQVAVKMDSKSGEVIKFYNRDY